MEFLSRTNTPLRDGAQQVFALHGPDASLELSMLRALMKLREDALPVLPALLQAPPAGVLPLMAEQRQSAAASACPKPGSGRRVIGAEQLTEGTVRPGGLGNDTCALRSAELAAAAQAAAEADHLNTAQAVALRSAAAWLEPDEQVTSATSP